MAYNNKISGIGNATTRINEITPEDLAVIRNYIFGFDSGVINGFTQTLNDEKTELTISKGLCFAYGYMGYEEEKKFVFNKTSAEQYHFIYGEFDLSKIPNTFELKVKNNQGGATIKPTTFRQDILSSVRTGVYQLPLYRVKLDNTGVVEIVGIKDNNIIGQGDTIYRNYPKRVEYTPITNKIIGTIDDSVTATTQDINDNSKNIATTDFVHKATRYYIDGYYADDLVTINVRPNNTARGSVSPNILKFNFFNYNRGQEIITTPKSGFTVSSFSYSSDINIEKIGENHYLVSLINQPTEEQEYTITVNFIH